MLTRDQEIWGMALWVEKHHPDDGHGFIEERITTLEAEGEADGVKLWQRVGECYRQLRTLPIPIYGQPETWPN